MARVFQTGFETGSVQQFDLQASGSIISTNTRGSWSGYAHEPLTTGGEQSLPATYTELYGGIGVYRNGDVTNGFITFKEGATFHLTIGLLNGAISVWRGTDSGTLLGSGAIMQDLAWSYVEWRFTISDTTGIVTIKLNGSTTISLTSQDTRNAGTSGVIDRFVLGDAVGNTNNFILDDLVLNDTTGAQNNGFPGDTKVGVLMPNAAGDVTGLSRGGTDSGANWSQVEERPPNDATDYVFDTVVNDYDLYALPNLSAFSSVQAVNIWLRAQKDDAGAASIAPMLKSAATEHTGADQTLSTSWAYYRQLYDVDPTDSAAWTTSKVDALQAGAKAR